MTPHYFYINKPCTVIIDGDWLDIRFGDEQVALLPMEYILRPEGPCGTSYSSKHIFVPPAGLEVVDGGDA
jgi:hypothetical protein